MKRRVLRGEADERVVDECVGRGAPDPVAQVAAQHRLGVVVVPDDRVPRAAGVGDPVAAVGDGAAVAVEADHARQDVRVLRAAHDAVERVAADDGAAVPRGAHAHVGRRGEQVVVHARPGVSHGHAAGADADVGVGDLQPQNRKTMARQFS